MCSSDLTQSFSNSFGILKGKGILEQKTTMVQYKYNCKKQQKKKKNCLIFIVERGGDLYPNSSHKKGNLISVELQSS